MFERKVDVQEFEFGWVRFQNRFKKKLLNNDDEKHSKNSIVN